MTRKSYKLPVRVLTDHITKLEDMAVRADEPLVEVAARVLAAALESSEPIPAKDRMSALEFIEYIDK